MDLQISETSVFITYLNAAIALAALGLSISNRRTQLDSYRLTRSTHRSNTNDFHVISAEQLDDSVLVKLVFFNPGAVAAVIQSLAVYEIPRAIWWLPRRFDWLRRKRIESVKWWPTCDENEKTPRLFSDRYQQLLVKESRVILVRFAGRINRLTHAFELKTNHGEITTWHTLDFIEKSFACQSHRSFS
ncbi:hypothetical protein SAMN05216598_4265 [Pseudomonas asplenii]|uniref:Uncharacterized protein n=1 Tax=Pseudomonas asplenii TaxID=53407 RepID=A0A1H1Y7D3_9PSED|nr:hypothetical protein [Pseudomonas asplenii]SDT17314.1 hypothetical protein SAMN05216598_4265 [Pseudomonas asplenii]